MALLERVATLIRANLNDLIDQAEEPEKMIKQVILDMQNQLLQVKTQVASAIADQHLLMKKEKENQDAASDWVRKAELAVEKGHDDLARAALERSMTSQSMSSSFAEQVADQTTQVENRRGRADIQGRAEEMKLAAVRVAAHQRQVSRDLVQIGVVRIAPEQVEELLAANECHHIGQPIVALAGESRAALRAARAAVRIELEVTEFRAE